MDLFFEKNFEEFIKNGETKMKDKNLKSEETESSWILPAVRKACRGFLKYEGKHTMYTQTYIFIK